MTDTTARTSFIVPALLALAMLATRFHHFGIGEVLPDASVAVFFLLGVAGLGRVWLAAFFALGFGIDVAAIGLANVSDVCFTWGYAFMLPAYAALWFAGRFVAGRDYAGFVGGARVGIALLAGVVAFFVISNLGYYLGGGFAESHGAAGYAEAVVTYFPSYLKWASFYVIVALVLAVFAPRVIGQRV